MCLGSGAFSDSDSGQWSQRYALQEWQALYYRNTTTTTTSTTTTNNNNNNEWMIADYAFDFVFIVDPILIFYQEALISTAA